MSAFGERTSGQCTPHSVGVLTCTSTLVMVSIMALVVTNHYCKHNLKIIAASEQYRP